jgi:hypothetical protein
MLEGCAQLQVLSAMRCSLGPQAGCAAAKLLRAKECTLTQLNLAHCSSIGVVSPCWPCDGIMILLLDACVCKCYSFHAAKLCKLGADTQATITLGSS